MPEVDVKNGHNEKIGTMILEDPIFGLKVSTGLLHEATQMQLASMRQGTAATKTRGLVSGGGKKPWKQKGTGRARAGSNRSPIWRGGGTTF
ncbi:MAG TPA: 50S ribosomal protein L4, partial [Candidatus Manganitrophaceae bacterium]